jgi:glycosyltransferase involved in cell wall biosynthesis
MKPQAGGPIRVAHIIQNLNYGGMEQVLHNLAQRLSKEGFDVHVVVIEYLGHFAQGLEEHVTLHQVPPMPRWSLLHPGALIAAIRAIAPDVVHSHGGVWLKAARAARSARVGTVVHTDHGRSDPIPLVDRLVDNAASRVTDRIIAVSDSLARTLQSQVVHDPTIVQVITNGVDLDRLRPPSDRAQLRHSLGLPVDAPIIGSIGRLEPVKNYQLALRAFARLGNGVSNGASPRLVLAGDGSDRSQLEILAEELGISDRVIFLGWRDDPGRLFGCFDLFTLSSLSEGTSISLLESMGSAVCPAVTDVGGNSAVMGPELSSLLVPSNDAESLAELWKRLLASPLERSRLAQLARARVQEQFSLEAMVARHADLYRELLDRGRH